MKMICQLICKHMRILQMIFIYAWLVVLSPLSSSDEYYSIYVLCGMVGLFCLYANWNYILRGGTYHEKCLHIVFVAIVFAVAVILANYALFLPLTVLEKLFNLIFSFFGGFFVAWNVLIFFMRHLPLRTKRQEEKFIWRLFFAVFFSIAAIDLVFLFKVAYPGILTRDSVTTISQIMGDAPFDNLMPFWHTSLVGIFVKLGMYLFENMNAAVACFHVIQILFMALVFAYVIVTMYQMGVPQWMMVFSYVLYAFMPYNIVYSVTLWKDIPFSCSAVLFITAFYRILKDIGSNRVLNYGMFGIGVIGFSLMRTNGWYAFFATTIGMFFVLRKKHKNLLRLMVSLLLVCWLLLNPVLMLLGVENGSLVEAFAIPMQQVARVVSNDREITQEQQTLLAEIFDIEALAEVYDPQTVDPVKFSTFRYSKVDYIVENLSSYVRLYMELGFQYPGDYLKAWIEETKGYWNGGYSFWIYTLNISDNAYGIARTGQNNFVTDIYYAWFRYIQKPAEWCIISAAMLKAINVAAEVLKQDNIIVNLCY